MDLIELLAQRIVQHGYRPIGPALPGGASAQWGPGEAEWIALYQFWIKRLRKVQQTYRAFGLDLIQDAPPVRWGNNHAINDFDPMSVPKKARVAGLLMVPWLGAVTPGYASWRVFGRARGMHDGSRLQGFERVQRIAEATQKKIEQFERYEKGDPLAPTSNMVVGADGQTQKVTLYAYEWRFLFEYGLASATLRHALESWRGAAKSEAWSEVSGLCFQMAFALGGGAEGAFRSPPRVVRPVGLQLVGRNVYVSPAGLRYVPDKKTDRVMHVLMHLRPKRPWSKKPDHDVWRFSPREVIRLIDNAYVRRGKPEPDDPYAYVVKMPMVVGTQGQTHVRLAIIPNTTRILSAYPYVPQEN